MFDKPTHLALRVLGKIVRQLFRKRFRFLRFFSSTLSCFFVENDVYCAYEND